MRTSRTTAACRRPSRHAVRSCLSRGSGRWTASRATSGRSRCSPRRPIATTTRTTAAGHSRAQRSISRSVRRDGRSATSSDATPGRHVRRLRGPRRPAFHRPAPLVPGGPPHAALQARRHARTGRPASSTSSASSAASTRSTSRGSTGDGRRQPARPGPVPPRARGVPRCLDRGSRAHRRDAALLEPHADRVTWDAPIHAVADIEALRWPPRTVNVKPSRFGSIERLFAAYDYCEAHGIGAYGGGQWELSIGRGHIQLLAALFHPDTPNDVAPGGYNAPEPSPDLPASPMPIAARATGFLAV